MFGLQFPGGCIANLTASRVSTERVRKLRLFQPHEYISLDYSRQDAVRFRVNPPMAIDFAALPVIKDEPLRLEARGFLRKHQHSPSATRYRRARLAALEVALSILDKIEEHSRLVAEALDAKQPRAGRKRRYDWLFSNAVPCHCRRSRGLWIFSVNGAEPCRSRRILRAWLWFDSGARRRGRCRSSGLPEVIPPPRRAPMVTVELHQAVHLVLPQIFRADAERSQSGQGHSRTGRSQRVKRAPQPQAPRFRPPQPAPGPVSAPMSSLP